MGLPHFKENAKVPGAQTDSFAVMGNHRNETTSGTRLHGTLTHLGPRDLTFSPLPTLQKNVIRMDEKNMSLPGSPSFQRM